MMNLRRGRNPYFVGRDQILGDIRSKFDDPEGAAKIIALVGMGGAGKSSLALEYAMARKLQYDIIWWITADNPARITAEMAAGGSGSRNNSPAETDSASRQSRRRPRTLEPPRRLAADFRQRIIPRINSPPSFHGAGPGMF